MANISISTIPFEILLAIAEELSADDLLSFRQTCKSLSGGLKISHLRKLFGVRKYYISAIDLGALLRFSQHPSGANIYLKHLIIDFASPYLKVTPFLGKQILPRCRWTTLLDEETARRFETECSEELKGVSIRFSRGGNGQNTGALLAQAFQNFPNLERIECQRSYSPDRSVPSGVVAAHYPKQCGSPDQKLLFLDFFHNYGGTLHTFPIQMYSHLFFALGQITSPLKHLDHKAQHDWLKISWFTKSRDSLPHFKKAFSRLQTFQFFVQGVADDDTHQAQESSKTHLENFSLFLREAMPNLQECSFTNDYLYKTSAFGNSLWKNRHPFLMPTFLMDPPLFFQNLRKVEFCSQVFIEDELKAFLTNHKALRCVSLQACRLQSEHQIWSSLFELLATDLSLLSFGFDGTETTCFIFDDEFPRAKSVPHFDVHGDVRTEDHYCELLRVYMGKPGGPRVDFQTAMAVVKRLEQTYILNSTGVYPGLEGWDAQVFRFEEWYYDRIAMELVTVYLAELGMCELPERKFHP
ncbi:hypothetical protein ABW19_dt0206256 [Dactylella cylindrospora]|nr:hypothetical protein ABW19_dt0206256 [Dactylella cylindrospora]